MKKELQLVREKIDAIDSTILDLLNQRAALAAQAFSIKKNLQLPIQDEKREQEIIKQLLMQNHGLLQQENLEAIMNEIIKACLAIQK